MQLGETDVELASLIVVEACVAVKDGRGKFCEVKVPNKNDEREDTIPPVDDDSAPELVTSRCPATLGEDCTGELDTLEDN